MRVTLYRGHPAEGWPSMDRYAESLLDGLLHVAPEPCRFNMPMPPGPWPIPYGQLLNRLLCYPFWARRQQGDLNHVLDHSYGHLLFTLDPARTIVTVHDVAPLRFPGRRGGLSRLAWELAWHGMQPARCIIAVSTFSAAELQAHLSLSPSQLHVIHEGVSQCFRPQSTANVEAIRRRYLPDGGRLLMHVGHTQARKNLPTLFQAIALLRRQGVKAILVQIGGQPDTGQQKLVLELGLEQFIHFVGRVAEEVLVDFYNAADVFVFPSLYEGFGMPVLEAMACGTPVVASSAASLPEVMGDAGLLVDPCTPEALADAVARVLENRDLALALSQRGLARAQQFTWKRTAQETLEVYRQALEGIQ